MIKADHISKSYGHIQALKDISFEIAKGEIVGFLGRNGAGKTSLMRILTGFMTPTSGQAFISGMDIGKRPMDIKRRIGYLPETPPLYMSMTVHGYLRLAARLKEVHPFEEKKMIDKALADCLLTDVKDRVIGQLSKGYKQRVGIAQAIINDPEVLILDEPTTGLDPVQNKQVRELIKNLYQKRTVILSTHNLPEIQFIAKRVLIINNGTIVQDGELADLLKAAGSRKKIELKVRGKKEEIYHVISATDGPTLLSTDSKDDVHTMKLEFKTHTANYNTVVEKILKTGGELISVIEPAPSLEDIFFDAVGEEGRAV